MPSWTTSPRARRSACSLRRSSYPAASSTRSSAAGKSPLSYRAPKPFECGTVNGGSRLRRRTSAGSTPISAANRSIARSTAAVASGRPAPRYAPTGVVFVTTDRAYDSTLPKAYVPGVISRVSEGSSAPIRG
jgi:hypothetical protein